MEMALEGGKGGELDAVKGGGGGRWSKTPREGPKVCRIFYLERIVSSSWLTRELQNLYDHI